MNKRAAARDETRERIVRATMALHDEQGVATTTFADVAERARVGPATVLRHFPTLGSLVMACGQHVAGEMRPPSPADAKNVFTGQVTTAARLERLVSEIDAFYERGAFRLLAAGNDRDRVPELDQFLKMVDLGLEALIREATVDEHPAEPLISVLMALCSVNVWQRLNHAKFTDVQRQALLVDLLNCAIASVRSQKSDKTGRARPTHPNLDN
jgi:AcrR family transcriptional regulator